MRIQEKQKALEQEVIANLCAIPKMPENMLPHTVYVEEEGEDGYGHGIPVYTYKYDRKKHTENIRNHRRYKQRLFQEGKIILKDG